MTRHSIRYSYDRIEVYWAGGSGSLHAETIRRFLPKLWRNAFSSIDRGHLNFEDYADFDPPYRHRALHLIYDHLKDSQGGPGESIVITEGLDGAWRRSYPGRDEARSLFKALCHFLRKWGCHENLFLAMETFFIQHSREIVKRRTSAWVAYINALDSTCYDREKELTKTLGHVLRHHSPDFVYLGHLARHDKIHSDVIYLLEALLAKKRKQHNRKLMDRAGRYSDSLILHRGGHGALDYPRPHRGNPGINYDSEELHYIAEFERDRLEVLPPRRMPGFLDHMDGCPYSNCSSENISDLLEDSACCDSPESYFIDGISHGGRSLGDSFGNISEHDPFYNSPRLGIMD